MFLFGKAEIEKMGFRNYCELVKVEIANADRDGCMFGGDDDCAGVDGKKMGWQDWARRSDARELPPGADGE